MHTIPTTRHIPLDDMLDRSLRALLVAVGLLIAVSLAATADLSVSRNESTAPQQPVQVAGATLGAQLFELSSQDPPMVCLSCSSLV